MSNKALQIILNEHVWSGGRMVANTLIEMARDKFKEEGKHAIVAVEKHGKVQMLKDEFETVKELFTKRKGYIKQGYKVYYVTVKEPPMKFCDLNSCKSCTDEVCIKRSDTSGNK